MVTDETRRDLARTVTIARVRLNWTMQSLAEAAHVQVMTVSRLERAMPPGPERDTIVKVCDALEIDPKPFLD